MGESQKVCDQILFLRLEIKIFSSKRYLGLFCEMGIPHEKKKLYMTIDLQRKHLNFKKREVNVAYQGSNF